MNVRDWIYVDDHNQAVLLVLEKGKIGETYLIGVSNERNNNQISKMICEKLDLLYPIGDGTSYKKFITYVEDRAGHDKRYAINNKKITKELGFIPKYSFTEAIETTIKWYHQKFFND